MRTRTRISKGLVCHNNPDGSGCLSQRERAYNALRRLERIVNKGYSVSDVKVKKLQRTEEPKVVVKMFGEYVEITAEMAAKCNFKIEIL